jgi:uncharacterized membrane protein
MKYCFYTNLVIGLICAILQLAIAATWFSDISLYNSGGKIPKSFGEWFVTFIFGLIGTLLLVAAYKIRNKIHYDKLSASIREM